MREISKSSRSRRKTNNTMPPPSLNHLHQQIVSITQSSSSASMFHLFGPSVDFHICIHLRPDPPPTSAPSHTDQKNGGSQY